MTKSGRYDCYYLMVAIRQQDEQNGASGEVQPIPTKVSICSRAIAYFKLDMTRIKCYRRRAE